MRRWLQYGGFAAGIVLVIFGVVAIAMGASGRSTVSDSLRKEQIVGTPDMTPAAIKAEAKAAGLENVSLPTCNVAGKSVTSGSDARCFASYMRIHGLEATGGLTYSQMPRYASADGKGTNVAAQATKRAGPAARQPGARPCGSTRPRWHGPERRLHGRPALALRHRRRVRTAAVGHRLHHPRRVTAHCGRAQLRASRILRSPSPRSRSLRSPGSVPDWMRQTRRGSVRSRG